MPATAINSSNIKETINSAEVILVEFFAPWCPHCRRLAPIIDEVASEMQGKAAVCTVNTDENEDLLEPFGVEVYPTTFIFKNAELQETIVGETSKDNIVGKLEALLA